MTKQDVINYVCETPHNTNRAVLGTILDQYAVSDNKTEIELLAQENKVYTPATGKVYNKVTVNVPTSSSDIEVVNRGQNYLLDKTWQEINTLYEAGKDVILSIANEGVLSGKELYGNISDIGAPVDGEGRYYINFRNYVYTYYCDDANAYPEEDLD